MTLKPERSPGTRGTGRGIFRLPGPFPVGWVDHWGFSYWVVGAPWTSQESRLDRGVGPKEVRTSGGGRRTGVDRVLIHEPETLVCLDSRLGLNR